MKELPHPKVTPYEQDRKKTRWENYDYSCSGTYFVTFCTFERGCYFGGIKDGALVPSPQGSVAFVVLSLLPKLFPKIEMLNFAVMPDHIHLLLSIFNDEADLRAFEHRNDILENGERYAKESLSSFISSCKSSITRYCHQQHLEIKWQKGFFDRVVRNTDEKAALDKYIRENPLKWDLVHNP